VQKERVKQGRVHVWRHARMPAKLQFCGMLQKSRKRQATFWTLLTPQRLPELALHNASMNVSVISCSLNPTPELNFTYRVGLLMLHAGAWFWHMDLCLTLGWKVPSLARASHLYFHSDHIDTPQQNTQVLSNLLKLWSLLTWTRQSRLGNSTLVGAFVHHQKPLLVH